MLAIRHIKSSTIMIILDNMMQNVFLLVFGLTQLYKFVLKHQWNLLRISMMSLGRLELNYFVWYNVWQKM